MGQEQVEPAGLLVTGEGAGAGGDPVDHGEERQDDAEDARVQIAGRCGVDVQRLT